MKRNRAILANMDRETLSAVFDRRDLRAADRRRRDDTHAAGARVHRATWGGAASTRHDDRAGRRSKSVGVGSTGRS